MYRCLLAVALTVCCLLPVLRAGAAETSVDAAMLRYPDISATQIVFVYDNDIWIAPRGGGVAIPLSSPAGPESFPKFSPDGRAIAYSAGYDGNPEVYTIPAGGGLPQRLTCDPDNDRVIDYTPDGRVLFATAKAGNPHGSGFFYADPNGGLPEELPVAYGSFGAVNDSGEWLAYTLFSGEYATWKRYQGGRAADIWLFNLNTLESKQITDHPGADDLPMWHGSVLYYLSDGGADNRRNIWAYDTNTGKREQVTHFTEFDVRWPSIGPDAIVFQYGSELRVLDLVSRTASTVSITIPGDHPNVRTELIDVSDEVGGLMPSPNTKRAVGEFHGDIWTVPAKDGYPRNLTASSGVHERRPEWSPDGQAIAYFSDATGEFELYTRPSDGSGEPEQLTSGSETYYNSLSWSPDSKKILYTEKSGKYYVYDFDSAESVLIGESPWGRSGMSWSWAKDSNWIAYSLPEDKTSNGYIVLYDLANREAHQITTPMFSCYEPVFDQSGDWLFFTTGQDLNLQFGDWDETFIYTDSTMIAALPLRADVDNPFAPENDDEEMKPAEEEEDEPDAANVNGGDDDEDGAEADSADDNGGGNADQETGNDKDEDKDEAKGASKDEDQDDDDEESDHLKIDFDGIEARAIILPLAGGDYRNLQGGDKAVFYIKGGRGAGRKLMQYNLPDKDEKQILDDIGGYQLTPDGKKMLVNARGNFYFTKAAPGAKLEDAIPLRNMLVELDPRAEWREMVREAWRVYRDFFYDPGMHGVDWPAQLEHALALVDHAANREDVAYILGEMIAELNVGHAYIWGFDGESSPRRGIGRLGCDFAVAEDADGSTGIQIARIYRGADFEYGQRGPLSESGVDVNEGDFLLAVNGAPVSAEASPYAFLAGMAGQTVELTVCAKAAADGTERKVLVTPAGGDGELRLRDWIEAKREYVAAQSGGRIGYIYVRDTSPPGLADLTRQFNGQHEMDGLIIDERWNGGGMIPHRFIELLNRPVLCYWAVRDGNSWRTPQNSHQGPKAMLINQNAGSGGDAFPYLFRKLGLGKLIGTRTWGGLVGISGNPGLIDGSYLTVPTFGIYETDGTWAIEGYGVDPDIEVVDDPTLAAQGMDPQLDKAIEVVIDELKTDAYEPPAKPAYPDRSGAGIRPEEK